MVMSAWYMLYECTVYSYLRHHRRMTFVLKSYKIEHNFTKSSDAEKAYILILTLEMIQVKLQVILTSCVTASFKFTYKAKFPI